MDNTRRDFIKSTAVASVCAVAGCSTREQAPVDLDMAGFDWVKSVCRFCGTGCGVQLAVQDKRLVALRGDPDHPTTKGLVCAKALFLPKIVYSSDRLQKPQVRKNGQLEEASWERRSEWRELP